MKFKKKIFIITNSTFQLNHYIRLKIKDLLKKYDVHIIDLTKFYNAKPKIRKIKNFNNYIYFKSSKKLFDYITYQNPDLIIDSLGNNFLFKTWVIRCFFYKCNYNTLVLNRGLQPKIIFNVTNLLKIYFFNPKYFYLSLVNFLSKKVIKVIYQNVRPKFFVSSGLKSDHEKYQQKKFFLYSYDYGNHLINKNKKKIVREKYALFIDENIVHHPDYHNSNYPRPPASQKQYYKNLNRFFLKFEEQNKVKIIIALHPTTDKNTAKYFKKFKSFYNLTGRLIKDAKLVLIHSSTAKHVAAVYKKPLIFLTSNEINKSWFKTYINENQKLFDAQILNIDSNNTSVKSYKIDQKKYKNFLNNYVIHPKFKNKTNNFLKIIDNILINE